MGQFIAEGNIFNVKIFVASCAWVLCVHGLILLSLDILGFSLFWWASHFRHIHYPTYRACTFFPAPLLAFSEASLKPSQNVCFRRVLICILNIPNAGHFVNLWYTYMNDFYFHCHDKDLWSSLLCRLYWWRKMSHFFL